NENVTIGAHSGQQTGNGATVHAVRHAGIAFACAIDGMRHFPGMLQHALRLGVESAWQGLQPLGERGIRGCRVLIRYIHIQPVFSTVVQDAAAAASAAPEKSTCAGKRLLPTPGSRVSRRQWCPAGQCLMWPVAAGATAACSWPGAIPSPPSISTLD